MNPSESPSSAVVSESEKKRRLRELLQQHQGGEDHFPLSFSQTSYWFFCHVTPDSPLYINSLELDFHGPIDEALLETALNDVVRRSRVLQTYFPVGEQGPVQAVPRRFTPTALNVIDLTHLPEAEREGAARELIIADARKPFTPLVSAPFRAELLRLGPERRILVVSIHHILIDGNSEPLFAQKLADAYRHFAAASPTTQRPALDYQYADYAVWQRNHIQGEILEKGLAYWTERLAGLNPEVDFPLDKVRPPRPSFRGAHSSLALDLEILRSFETLGREEGVTPFVAYLAALGACLFRLTGQGDLSIGTVVSNRDRPELERMLGDITNFLPLRLFYKEDVTFLEALRQTQDAVVNDYEHRDIPFMMLPEALQLERRTTANPLYNTSFLLHDEEWLYPVLDFGPGVRVDLNFKNRDVAGVSMLDLRFEVMKRPDRLLVDCEYSTDLFEARTVERVQRYFRSVLRAVAANPNLRLSELPGREDPEAGPIQQSHPRRSVTETTEPTVAPGTSTTSVPVDGPGTPAAETSMTSSPNLYEQRVQAGWKKILGIAAIESDANFF